MGIFNKKFDIENDHLNVFFEPNTKSYAVKGGHDIIPMEYLTKKSQRIILEKNKRLYETPGVLENEMKNIRILKRYQELQDLGLHLKSIEYLGKVEGSMSKPMADYLNYLVNEENVLLGIHRVGNISDDRILNILQEGLKMTGHMGGAIPGTDVLENNVGFYADNKVIIKELMYADQYKQSKGSILIRIPDEDLRGNIYITDKDGGKRLNPKYILGYVPLEPNHHISYFVTKDAPYFQKNFVENPNGVSYTEGVELRSSIRGGK